MPPDFLFMARRRPPKNIGASLIIFIFIEIKLTLGRYILEGFDKKNWKKLTNRYVTQSAQSNTGKQSWSRTALIIIIIIIIIIIMVMLL